VILHCNYEELSALRAGARSVLEGDAAAEYGVIAPPERRARVEALLPRLNGDLSVETLAELRSVATGVDAIVAELRAEMEAVVGATHPADEGAVAAYFEFAHALSVSLRIRQMRMEMEALVEVVTGRPPDEETARTFRFPD